MAYDVPVALPPNQTEAPSVGSQPAHHRGPVWVLVATVCLSLPARWVGAAFEDSFAGARALAMGGAHVAIADGTESLAANPAGLAAARAEARRRRLSASYGGLYLGLSDGNQLTQGYMAYTSAAGRHGGNGLAWKHTQGGGLYSEDSLAIGIARRLTLLGEAADGTPRLSVGVQADVLRWDAAPTTGVAGNVLEDLSGPTRVGVIVGARYTLTATDAVRVPLGVVFRHVNEPDVASSASVVEEPVKLQTAFGIGAIGKRTMWALDIEMSRRNVDVRSGFEWEAHPDALWLRAGLRLEGLALGTNVTFGGGVSLRPSSRIDYAFWLPIGNITETVGGHRISVVYAF